MSANAAIGMPQFAIGPQKCVLYGINHESEISTQYQFHRMKENPTKNNIQSNGIECNDNTILYNVYIFF